MEFTSPAAARHYAALVRAAPRTVIGLDFDGTLAPIVDDPARARIHPRAHEVLVTLAERVAAIAVITGRPARQALDLGGLEAIGVAVAAAGASLHVFGQYGNERWTSGQRRIVSPRPPGGLAGFESELPALLRRLDLGRAHVESKGLAVAVHTRRLADADAAFERLLPAMTALARAHDLVVEPGRSVIEVRSPGMHKGLAVRQIAAECDAAGFLFAGDDLGDLEAFQAVRDLAHDGVAGLLVCSTSDEENALQASADVVVPGPDGVLDLLTRFAADAGGLGSRG